MKKKGQKKHSHALYITVTHLKLHVTEGCSKTSSDQRSSSQLPVGKLTYDYTICMVQRVGGRGYRTAYIVHYGNIIYGTGNIKSLRCNTCRDSKLQVCGGPVRDDRI